MRKWSSPVPESPLCSLAILAGLGLLGVALPSGAAAQSRLLTPGTLPVLRGIVGGQAIVNAPGSTASGRSLVIDQQSQRAIIDWKSFDIAAGSEVRFNQPGSTASALNRIYSLAPSQIQGRLSANGQILLINQNGILFDRGAQVNVQSLVASTLNVSNDRFNSGALTSGGLSTPAFLGGYDDQGNTLPARPDGSRPGAITLDNATLQAAQGGSILLVAPHVENAGGVIAAPDGQVILAAGSKAWLALPDADDKSGLRGFRVEVEASPDAPLNLSSLIRNAGDIGAARGNVTLAGLAINQEGRTSASTAIQANGTVFLQARSKDGTQAGQVLFAAGSRTEVRPDASDTATLPESQSYADRRGQIVVEGRSIVSSGILAAPGGQITLTASDPKDPAGARVYLGQGSTTSVAGNWADVPYAENLLTFKVTSNELKDSPDQKVGILKGSTVTVDLRKGSPLLDLSGYVAAQGRTVAEKTAVGGVLNIASSGSLIQRQGATLDASGGGYVYGAGAAATSKLLGADGRIYDIGSAPEATTYVKQLDRFDKVYPRWGAGVTQSFTGLLYGAAGQEAGYVEGKPGGSINLRSAAGLVLDGTLLGGATTGPRQLSQAPRGASLGIGRFDATANDFASDQLIGNVRFVQRSTDTLGAGFLMDGVLSGDQAANVSLSAEQLFNPSPDAGRGLYAQTAFDTVELNVNGRVQLDQGIGIAGAPGSTLSVRAPQIDIAGSVSMPAGTITLQPTFTQRPIDSGLDARSLGVRVRGSAALSTAGNWINNAGVGDAFIGRALPAGRLNVAADGTSGTTSMLDGGALTIGATDVSSTVLERGASLDVGGGGALDRDRRFTGGNGGSLSIANGLAGSGSSDWMQASVSGFAAANGGKLTLSTPRVEIAPADANGTLPADTTRLSPELFAEHGFSSVKVATTKGIQLRTGTTLELGQKNLVVDPVAAVSLDTGGDLRSVSTVQRLGDDQRQAMNLTLATAGSGTVSGSAALSMAQGARIVADPRAKVSLSAVDGMTLDGTISAPGGTVSLLLNAPATQNPAAPVPDLRLGSTADISVASSFVAKANANGLLQGTLIDAGTIGIEARNAGLDLAAGSHLDLHATVQHVQMLDAGTPGAVVEQLQHANAGVLALKSQGGFAFGSTVNATAASAASAAGSFSLELKAPDSPQAQPPERRIVVGGAPGLAPEAGFVDAFISTDALRRQGFDKLRLLSENRIEFRGDAVADFARGVRLDAPLIDLRNDARVSLRGSTVSLGQSLDPRGADFSRSPRGPSPVLATAAGAGLLTVEAQTIDLFGSITLNGVVETRLFADHDIRLTGREVTLPAQAGETQKGGQVGGLTSSGDLSLRAAEVYPSTRSDFTLSVVSQPDGRAVPGGTIRIDSSGHEPGDVYSAGGRVTLNADNILQGGVLKAPLGQLALNATSLLELLPGSVTSASAGGLTVPYGQTHAGLDWTYQDGSASRNPLQAPSAGGKQLSLAGRRVSVDAGATVDLSGGGEVAAIEWVPGSGGSKDSLLKDNTFAIIPRSKLTSMPVDSDIASLKDLGFGLQAANPDAGTYDSLTIGPGAAVPAGEYVLLPGRYALLPGAYLVQLQTGSAFANLRTDQTLTLANGQMVVSGVRGASGTGVREARTVGVVVRPGSDALREADYTITGSLYFAERAAQDRVPAPRLPIDAGRLAISNVSGLSLDGTFHMDAGQVNTATSTARGRGAEVDISADRIAVVDRVGAAGFDPAVLQLDGGRLSALGSSILLGGKRNDTSDGVLLSTGASEVTVANSAAGALKAPELMLAATDLIDVRPGSVLMTGSGTGGDAPTSSLRADGNGALLRLSSGPAAGLERTNATSGEIRIGAGSLLAAGKTMLIDATGAVKSQGNLKVGGSNGAGGALSVASGQISLGQTDGVAGLDQSLVLSNDALAGFASLDAFTLKGYQDITLYGSTQVGATTLGSLTLDTPLLSASAVAGNGTPASSIAATDIALVNTHGVGAGTATPGLGTLSLHAERLHIGAGDKVLGGFGDVSMFASRQVLGEGIGRTTVGSSWHLASPRVAMTSGADQEWLAADFGNPSAPGGFALSFLPLGATQADAVPDETGGRLSAQGRSVSVATLLQARSGRIALTASGPGSGDDVTLASGATLDASGLSKDFHGNTVSVDAGSVRLASAAGAVRLAAGSTVDVSADARGGGAGAVEVQAQALDVQGSLRGAAGAATGGGSVAIDVAALPNFSALNQQLGHGGFTGARDLRVRNGDIVVAAGDVVKAHDIQLAADTGRIEVAGTLDASSVQGGGSVKAWASHGLSLAAGSRVLASGSSTDGSAAAPLSRGGTVELATTGGRLSFDSASTIDVSPGAKGSTGSVVFRTQRDASNVMGDTSLDGKVLGLSQGHGQAARIVLEAERSYDAVGTIGAADIAGYAADHAAFIAGTDPAQRLAGLKADPGVVLDARLQGATQVRSSGDLSVGDWDLTTADWLASGLPGTLTLRARGNLSITGALGNPKDTVDRRTGIVSNDGLLDGRTWNMRMVGGADLNGANPLATQSADSTGATGNVLLTSSASRLRTGTGSIEIAAATDFAMNAAQSVVYTAGRIGSVDTVANAGNRWSREGGDITILAGRDLRGAGSEQAVTEWLRRPRPGPRDSLTAEWWAYRPNFSAGVGTLGGGDIRFVAGRDIDSLSAMLPTTGRAAKGADGSPIVDVQGGGNLLVQAAGDISGGAYLVGRGEGRLHAGGDVGSSTVPTQLFMMGASSGLVPEQATVRIEAGAGVTLKGVNNPTAMFMANSKGSGPSFGAGGSSKVSTFFTYSDNSLLEVAAASGDLTLGSQTPGSALVNAVYPVTIKAAALEGNVRGDAEAGKGLVTYPSAGGRIALLAQGSVQDINLSPSDRDPGSVSKVGNPRLQLSRQLTAADVSSAGAPSRIVRRADGEGYVYDVQALAGSVQSTIADAIDFELPARSRVEAGVDIKHVTLTLQNLSDSDTSIARAHEGDIRPESIEVRGPGRLLLQSGRNIDLGPAARSLSGNDIGGLTATGNNTNNSLPSPQSARITAIAGVKADVDLAKLDAVYSALIALNTRADEALAFYRLLNGDPDRGAVLAASGVGDLAARDKAYGPYVDLGAKFPRLLAAYQAALKSGALPLAASTDATQAADLYALLNRESNALAITNARGIADLVNSLPDGSAYARFVEFDARYPRVFADYRARRSKGALPAGLTPIVFSDALQGVIAEAVPPSAVSGGGISSYLSSIQTYGGSDIDLWAPGGNIVVGLTTPPQGKTIGVVTNGGGAIRGVLSGDFSINQGKVLTAQGGDILIFSGAGSIDAGRGAKTSISTPPPKRTPVFQVDEQGNPVQVGGENVVIGYVYTLPASASGSGIQTLTSDPDGLGPLQAPTAGSIYLFAPAGTIDAGEAGIRSGGNIVLNAQTVLNATNISSAGTAVGVPVVQAGSLSTSLATSGANVAGGTKAAEEAGAAAAAAARAAAAAPFVKPNILSVEVLGFGDKNCKEGDKDCFAK